MAKDIIEIPAWAYINSSQAYTANTAETTMTNANAFIGLALFPNNITNNVLVYSVLVGCTDTAGTIEASITKASSIDTLLTVTNTPVNKNLASGASSLVTAKNTANNTGNTTKTGTNLLLVNLPATNSMQLILPDDGFYIPAKTSATVIQVYVKVPTAGKVAYINVQYLEWQN